MRVLLVLLVLFVSCNSQKETKQKKETKEINKKNVFSDRDFWAENPSVEDIKQKITEGNDPVAMTKSAFDGVTYAILGKASKESIAYLLTLKGNEVTKLTHDGRNYLLWAAYKGDISVVKMLIDKGSDVNLVDSHGYNVLTFAAVGGQQNTALYDLILSTGHRIDETNSVGANALLLLAHAIDNQETFTYFIEKGLDIASEDAKGNTIFNYAASSGNKFVMQKAIDLKLDYKKLNTDGVNAFMFAAKGKRRKTNDLTVFKYLDSLGLDANIITKDQETPLHALAYYQKDPKVFDFFIEKGVDVNVKDAEGNIAFLNAIVSDNFEIAKKLLPLTEDVNYKNKKGYAALTYAVRNQSIETFKYLINNNADALVKDEKNNGLMAHLFDVYKESKKDDFLNMLAILQSKKITPTIDAEGNNLLHKAVAIGAEILVEKALSFDEAINLKNAKGLTPLQVAVMKAKDLKIVQLLVAKGADITIKTDFEESIYDLASENELLKTDLNALAFLKTN